MTYGETIRQEWREKGIFALYRDESISLKQIVETKWMSSGVYTIVRFLFVAYWVFWMAYSIEQDGQEGVADVWMTALTNWSLTLTTFYFIVSFVMAVHAWKTERDGDAVPLGIPTPARIKWALGSLMLSVSFFVMVLYWALVYDPDKSNLDNGVSINTHGITFVFMVADTFLHSAPFHLAHIWLTYLYCVVYLVFNLLYFAADSSNIVYEALDWGNSTSGAIIYTLVLLIVGIPLTQFIVWNIAYLRDKLQGKGPESNSVEMKRARGESSESSESSSEQEGSNI